MTTNPADDAIDTNAVSIYGGADGMDEFPVLKAFQQYIDAEQAKARKRMLAMGIGFCIVVAIIVAVFSILLITSTNRNQQLNDRLIEYAMKDRDTKAETAVRMQQDSAAIAAITKRLEDLQGALAESKSKNAKLVEAAKAPSAAEIEVERLKVVLQKERELAAQEKERERLAREKQQKREEELEAYRRKHYPEFYRKKIKVRQPVVIDDDDDDVELDDDDVNDILNDLDDDAIEYFDEAKPKKSVKSVKRSSARKSTKKKSTGYSIPVEIKSSSGGSWRIPEE